ncbi:type III secretion protein [Rhodomicrobium udaipurense JA643]|uniref:Type III secretion system export apparatus subunit SctV n=1 Tax=Rhodomicrobium udaipurense TaxID=1202716 RepID=A0A8I1KK11_9HYPH|nr:type III secretion system export apparatus subunit SctV [Rhodomicrobium udaipurense]KAI95303.1 type III secretion protein [Rhodomicrobium udaipurense JA643]MBJ7544437.1 type III secretion system export apparatus subunit SctV [Rhodomicrobium udaipurense]
MRSSATYLARLLNAASTRPDLVVVVFIVTALAAMILPITPLMADVLIATNISFSVLLLMVAFYVRSPVEFSALPAVILISTVFRLSISIASTRLVLINADAGQIIETFGEFVISGNVLVGLVVFLIITIVQFVVITKGSERVAEVAARFSLDGLPGKQMSIDSDLRNGDIDQAEARRRRQLLERESQLYGAMDGAMKFVKGDAIAGIIIIVINLIGGIAVGMMQRGLSFNDSAHVFSLLSVGEGLIAQIPALFVSLTAGIIVTRVTGGASRNLGTDIVSQIGAQPEALRIAALVLLALAMVPGFPTFVFLALAAIVGGLGIAMGRRQKRREEEATLPVARLMTAEISAQSPVPAGPQIVVTLSPYLFENLKHDGVDQRLRQIAHRVTQGLGISTPGIAFHIDETLPASRYVIELEMVPEIVRDVDQGCVFLVRKVEQQLAKLDIPHDTLQAGTRNEIVAVDQSFRTALDGASLRYLTLAQLIENDLLLVLRQNAAHFLGIQETRRLIASMEGDYKDLVREVQKVVPIQRMADVLKRLLEERVSIRNLRLIFEALLEWAPREQDNYALTTHVRAVLKRQISFQAGGTDKVVPALLVPRESEDMLRRAAQQALARNQQNIDPDLGNAFVEMVRSRSAGLDELIAERAVVLVSADLRRLVWGLLSKTDLRFPVISYQEISPEFSIRTLAVIDLAPRVEAAAAAE